MVTPDAKRKAVAHACDGHGVSQRRACQALNIDRSTVRYVSTRPDDAPLRAAMKAVASERRRFGYRRIHLMLERQGIGTHPAWAAGDQASGFERACMRCLFIRSTSVSMP